jgi:SAM-dependent methyltransferase
VASFISFIPTPAEQIEAFFELARPLKADIVYDLGSGDGRLLFAALEKGAGKAVGIELNPQLVRQAVATAKNKGFEDRIVFLETDVMDVNLQDATIVLCYLSARGAASLRPKFEAELRPGTRVVAEFFPIPGWRPLKTIKKQGKPFHLFTMPPEFNPQDEVNDPLLDYLFPHVNH